MHLASSITQAINLIVASGSDFNTFYMRFIDAYKVTSQRNGLGNRSDYFFTALRDSLLPSDTVSSHIRLLPTTAVSLGPATETATHLLSRRPRYPSG